MPSHEELLIKSSGTGSLLLYYGYPLRRPCIRHWPLLSTLSYCSRRTNLAEATLDLHAESIWRSKRNRCIVHVWCERRFNFSVWNSLFYTRSIALWILEKVWKRFFAIQILGRFFLYFLSIGGIERKIYDALENFVIVI